MVRFIKMGLMLLVLLGTMLFIAHSSSTPYSNQDIRGLLSRLPLSWMERTVLADISFAYGGRQIGIAHTGVESFVEFFMRKAAHFFSFMAIGALCCRLLAYIFRLRFAVVAASVAVMAYAAIDEYRQSFIPDRTPLVEDVLLDTAGGLTGILLVSLWVFFRRKRSGKRHIKRMQQIGARTRMERKQFASNNKRAH